MISIDLQCQQGHRFEGYFKDYDTHIDQISNRMIACPLCESTDVKRIYTGCSIQAKTSLQSSIEKKHPNLFETIRSINQYVRENYENVGDKFPDVARAIHCGIEEKRNIYGKSSPEEIQDLAEDGIDVIPLIDIGNHEN